MKVPLTVGLAPIIGHKAPAKLQVLATGTEHFAEKSTRVGA